MRSELGLWLVGTFWLIIDFLAVCMVAAWMDDYEYHFKQKQDEQRQDEQR